VTTNRPESDHAAKPRRTTRRRLLKVGLGVLVGGAGLGAYARWIEPLWLRIVQQDLPVAHLPPAWDGLRVVQMSDLHHCSWGVSLDHLQGVFRQALALRPDLLVVTGDFVTDGQPQSGEEVAEICRDLSAPCGVFACLGNHDFGIGRPRTNPPSTPLPVAQALSAAGIRVLQNEALPLAREGQTLWLVGISDWWSGAFRPRDAMKNVPAGAPTLILCHNPDAAEAVDAVGGGTILAGHTHGGQVQVPFYGPPILPIVNRDRYEGLHRVGGSWVYVNRGVGWAPYKVRLNCRPEISLLTLRPAPDMSVY
jgi:uncharacterized protein